MPRTLASLLLACSLLAPACSKKADEVRTMERALAPSSMAVDQVAVGSAAAPTAADGGDGFTDYGQNPWVDAKKDHLSTFAADVDTASYTISRRMLTEDRLPRLRRCASRSSSTTSATRSRRPRRMRRSRW